VSGCPGLDTLEQGGPVVETHLRRCEACRVIRSLMTPESGDQAAPSTLMLEEIAPQARGDCALAELLIAAGPGSHLGDTDAAFLPAHIAQCPGCREAALDPPPATDLQLPLVSPQTYVLGAEIGRGGMGRVLSARDRRTGRTVAVKEMLATRPGARERFEREARITARLQHPGIVSIYEVGQWPDGRPFYAMPILTGRTLAEAIAAAPRLRERLHLLPSLIAAADAIAYAHSRRIIHRDLTPANILLGSFGETVVIDWGLAKDLETDDASGEPGVSPEAPVPPAAGTRDPRLTAVGTVIGTPAYIAPEQAEGQAVDERADVYALGAILYHLLAGKPPYHGHGSLTVIAKLRARESATNVWTDPGRPRDLASVARRAMDPDPTRRYESAAELVEELRRFQLLQRVRAHRYSVPELAGRWLSRRIVSVAVSALVLALVAAGAVVGGVKVSRERNRAETITTTLLAEQGRQELLAGAPSRALVYLREAHRRGDTSPALRLLLASALRSVEARGQSFEPAGHPAGLAFSPDGRYLAVAVVGASVGVDLRDIRSGQQVRLITDARSAFGRLAFSPEGSHLATWGSDGPIDTGVTLWRTHSWVRGRVLAAGRAVNHVEFSPDGKVLLVVAEDELGVEIYEVESGRRRLVVAPRPGERLRGHLLSDGRRFITFGDGGNPTIRDLATGQVLRVLAIEGAAIHSLQVSGDGARVLTTGSRGARLWDKAGAPVADLGSPGSVQSAQFSGDGSHVLVVGRDDDARLFEASSGRQVANLDGGTSSGWVRDVDESTFSRDGLRLVTATTGGARVWLAPTGTALETYDEIGSISAMAISPDGRWLATGTYERQVQLRDLSRSVLRGSKASIPPDNAPLSAGTPLAGVRVLGISADRRKVLVMPDSDPSRPEVRNAANLALELRLPPQGNLRLVALTPDGSGILTSDATGKVALWYVGGRRVEFSGFRQALFSHRFSPDGTRVYLQETDTRRAGLWDPRDGRLVAPIAPNRGMVPMFSPDGSLLAVWGEELAVWNSSDGKFRYNVSDFLPLMRAGFSADSTHLLLLSSEVGVIDARSGRLLSRMDSADATDAAFGPDNSLILTVSRDTTSVLDWRTRRVLIRLAGDGVGDDRSAYWLNAMVATWQGRRPELLDVDPRDRSAVVTRGRGRVYQWDLAMESRTPAELDGVIDRHRLAWRLEDGQLARVSEDDRDRQRRPAAAPRNLDFELGLPGRLPPNWLVEGSGFRASARAEPARPGRLVATLAGPARGFTPGSLIQIVDAESYRGQALRLRAAVRCEPGLPATLLLRARRVGLVEGLHNKVMSRELCSGQWRVVDLVGNVDADAVTLEFGVMLEGGGEVLVDDFSLLPVPGQ
jgi:serine/threonine protein kinase/WD40 repeat protein